MGTGEYVSVTNQNELVHAEVCLERQMLARFPAAEQESWPAISAATAPTRTRPPGWPRPATRQGTADPHPRGARRRSGRAALAAAGRGRLLVRVLPRRAGASAAVPGRRETPGSSHTGASSWPAPAPHPECVGWTGGAEGQVRTGAPPGRRAVVRPGAYSGQAWIRDRYGQY